MPGANVRRFLSGYTIQKAGEFSIIAVLYAAISYIGSRTTYAFELGIFVPGPHSLPQSLIEGFGVAFGFFLFTLYPLVILALLVPIRWLLLKKHKALIPIVSAALSIAYVQLWVVMLNYPFKALPHWAISALVISFIIVSSFKLYPEFSENYSRSTPQRA